MRTKLDYSSLGESKGTYSSSRGSSSYGSSTNSSVRQMKQKQFKVPSMASGGSAAGLAMGILAGAGVGVLAGILMAPDKGTTTRRRVADSASWVGRGITEAFSSSKNKVNSWVGKGSSMNRGNMNRGADNMGGNNRPEF